MIGVEGGELVLDRFVVELEHPELVGMLVGQATDHSGPLWACGEWWIFFTMLAFLKFYNIFNS